MMARQNRVLPTGEIVASPMRGLFMGNRGCLHDGEGRIVRLAQGRRWICCLTAFRDRKRPIMQPGRYTELFFLDEAVALAAGHRPCAECRREDYETFRDAWVAAFGGPRPPADAMDAVLDVQRRNREGGTMPAAGLPEGAFGLGPTGEPLLRHGDRLVPFGPSGYTAARPVAGRVVPLTPPAIRAILAAGYAPRIHPAAD